MEKGLCWTSLGISGLLLILFMLDLILKMPFGGLNRLVDILGALSCALVLYLGWDAFRDSR